METKLVLHPQLGCLPQDTLVLHFWKMIKLRELTEMTRDRWAQSREIGAVRAQILEFPVSKAHVAQLPEWLAFTFNIFLYCSLYPFDYKEVLTNKNNWMLIILQHDLQAQYRQKEHEMRLTWNARMRGMKIFPLLLGSGPSINFWSTVTDLPPWVITSVIVFTKSGIHAVPLGRICILNHPNSS